MFSPFVTWEEGGGGGRQLTCEATTAKVARCIFHNVLKTAGALPELLIPLWEQELHVGEVGKE